MIIYISISFTTANGEKHRRSKIYIAETMKGICKVSKQMAGKSGANKETLIVADKGWNQISILAKHLPKTR